MSVNPADLFLAGIGVISRGIDLIRDQIDDAGDHIGRICLISPMIEGGAPSSCGVEAAVPAGAAASLRPA